MVFRTGPSKFGIMLNWEVATIESPIYIFVMHLRNAYILHVVYTSTSVFFVFPFFLLCSRWTDTCEN